MTRRWSAAAGALATVFLAAACSVHSGPPPAEERVAPPRPSPTAPPEPYPPDGKVFLGVQTNAGPADFSAVNAFATATGHAPTALQFSQGWADDQFDRTKFDAIAAKGMLPVLSWEPWDYKSRNGPNQPAYRLAAIAGGTYDGYIQAWAKGIAALSYPVVVRFGHEMNGFWYPWCEQANGNHAGDYVRAWRHVHDLFVAAGARNVAWLWSPNVTYPGAAPLSDLYPGDSYVDWIGLSGYYGTAGRTSYISFDQIFTSTLSEVDALTHKPIVVTETGATNASGQQAHWITQMFAQLPAHPEVIGVIWFEAMKEIDWRIASAPAAAAAFAQGAADPRYQAPWAPNGIPRSG